VGRGCSIVDLTLRVRRHHAERDDYWVFPHEDFRMKTWGKLK